MDYNETSRDSARGIMMPKPAETVDAMERRRIDYMTDAIAKIIGREAAQELATDVYNAPPAAQQLTPYELSLLSRAGNRNAQGE